MSPIKLMTFLLTFLLFKLYNKSLTPPDPIACTINRFTYVTLTAGLISPNIIASSIKLITIVTVTRSNKPVL